MKRRSIWMAGAGAAAAAAGLGWQLWRGESGSSAAVVLDEPTTAFWRAAFPRPDGSLLAMATLRGRPLVLNFWATWCAPCVREMPELDRFARQFATRGGQVLGLAVDNAAAVSEFLLRTPVSYAIALAGFEGGALSHQLGNANGALPYTAVFNRHGAIVQRRLGESSVDELTGWTKAL
jgi:thiol-disulfide isomerase/thioredoxin